LIPLKRHVKLYQVTADLPPKKTVFLRLILGFWEIGLSAQDRQP